MTRPINNEPVYYFEWDAVEGKHILYDATIRVIVDNGARPKVHLTVLRRDESFENVNNVENVEFQHDMTGITYWHRRFAVWPLV